MIGKVGRNLLEKPIEKVGGGAVRCGAAEVAEISKAEKLS